MKTVRISSLIIGITMLIQWTFFIITGNVPEFQTAPLAISFHIVIEILTGIMLILVFILLSKPARWKKYLAVYAQGMLGYTSINSAGYFAQSGDWIFLVMFAVVLFFSVFNSYLIIRGKG